MRRYVGRIRRPQGGTDLHLSVIVSVGDDDRRRIAVADHEARRLAAGIDFDNGDARPRIVACIETFRLHQAAGNIEAAEWMLTALEERIAERNLPDWRKLRTVAKKATSFSLAFRRACTSQSDAIAAP